MNINEKLFTEFPPVATEQWENTIVKDLKGADYNKKLVWKTDEGFSVRPYYRAEDLENISYLDSLPNQFPYTRGFNVKGNPWNIVQEVKESNIAEANKIAVDSVNRGANTIAFNVKEVKSLADVEVLLANLDLENVGVQFNHAVSYPAFVELFVQYVQNKGYDKAKVNAAIDFDAIMYSLKQGEFFKSREEDLKEVLAILNLTADFKAFKILNVNGLAMHNAGATIVQELGYALGIANEYLAFAVENGIPVERLASRMQMTLSVGSNYFMEIAKLRAVRLLWSTMVDAYKPACDCAYRLHINTVASTWNKTMYDPYINMLRSTTEGMAAAIGGSDSIALQPFDVAYKTDDEFSRRISRNVQVILKEESYFDKVVDPAAGSYYIENLTNSIAEQAWLLFQHVEKEGGMLNLIVSGEVKTEIEKSCQKRDLDIATRKYILLGTNQYPNINETILDQIEDRKCCCAKGLKAYRGAMAFEELRLATEKYAKINGRPKVYLLKIGNLAMRQARAGFITNFFGCAGYQILEDAFETIQAGMEAAKAAQAQIVVLCSSDEEYATFGVEAANVIKTMDCKPMLVVAGNPECAEDLKTAGVDDFVHARVNVLETLKRYNEIILK